MTDVMTQPTAAEPAMAAARRLKVQELTLPFVLVVADGAVVTEQPAGALDEHRVLDLVMERAAASAAATQHEGDVA